MLACIVYVEVCVPCRVGHFACVNIPFIPALPSDVHSVLAHEQAICALCKGRDHSRKDLLNSIRKPFHYDFVRSEALEEVNQLQLLLCGAVVTGDSCSRLTLGAVGTTGQSGSREKERVE